MPDTLLIYCMGQINKKLNKLYNTYSFILICHKLLVQILTIIVL